LLIQLFPYHQFDHFIDGGILLQHLPRFFTVADGHNAVADLYAFLYVMGTVNDPHPDLFNAFNKTEKVLPLKIFQGCCRLIKNQYPDVVGNCPDDLYDLSFHQGQVFHRTGQVHFHFEGVLDDAFRLLAHAFFIQDSPNSPTENFCFLGTDKNVLNGIEIGNECLFLVDYAYTTVFCLGRILENHLLVFQKHASGIAFVYTGDHFHQGGFSGSIFPYKDHHFACIDPEIHIIQSRHSGEVLGNPFHEQQIGFTYFTLSQSRASCS